MGDFEKPLSPRHKLYLFRADDLPLLPCYARKGVRHSLTPFGRTQLHPLVSEANGQRGLDFARYEQNGGF